MKATNKLYEAPQAEIIAIESQGVLCASGGAVTGTSGNGGTFNMTIDSGYGW